MSGSYDEDDEVPHMLAVGTGDDLLNDEEAILDPHEEMMMMQTTEAMGNAPSPPPPVIDEEDVEPASIVEPKASPLTTNKPVDDSFESYIFDSDGDEDFQTRGKNHVIPVINSSPTKKKRPDITDNNTDPSTSPQSPSSKESTTKGDSSPPKSPGRFFGRKSYGGMYISPPSSSEYEASPTSARGPHQSAFSSPQANPPTTTNFRYPSSSPVIQTPPASMVMSTSSPPQQQQHAQSAPPGYGYNQKAPPPTIPDGKTPIVLESPQGYRQPSSSKVIVEQATSSTRRCSGSQNNAFIWGMSKPVFCILAFYLLFMTGCFAYFVSQYVQIPGLKDQVEALSAEVDRLEAQVDELEELLSILNETVIELGTEVSELQVENDKLAQQNEILTEENETFGNATALLQQQIDTLQGTLSNMTLENEALKEEAFQLELLNNELTNLTVSLNETNTELNATVENLTAVNEEMLQSNEALTNQTAELQESLKEVVLEFDAAYETVVELQDEMALLQEENDRLANLTSSLGTILSFLEETNQDADLTVDQLAGQLQEQITNSRRLVLENLQNTLTQRTQTWNCDYVNAFSGSSFAQDFNVPIPSGNYDAVMDYVETRVLQDLCLDRSDFELYLSVNFMPNGDGLTSNELISGVSMYTNDAIDHYFPDSGEDGVTPEEWAEASYDCSNLPTDRQYRSTI